MARHEHIPIWRSHRFDFARSFFRAVELLWISGVTGALLILGFVAFVIYWHFNTPGPGKAVAALAVAAAIMTCRTMAGVEKLGWVIVLFAFLSVENRSINKERAEANERQNEAARANQREFSATMERMNALADQASKNLCEANGCDSFCYLTLDDVGRPAVMNVGKYPLYGVEVRVVDLANFKQNPVGNSLRVGDLPVNKVWFNFVPLLAAGKERADINVFITAKNGSWAEQLKMRRINGKWERATLVEPENFGPAPAPRPLPFKEITPGFPKEELQWK